MKTNHVHIPDIISDIPSLPVVATRILQIIADEAASLQELKKVIALDQSFSARLLRVANSPYYRAQKTISDITDAITRIGLTTVQALIFAVSLRDLRRSAGRIDRMIWEHNLGVSVACQLVARQAALPGMSDIAVHGLMHDIGKVFLNLLDKNRFSDVIEDVDNREKPFFQVEQTTFGFDHADVGRHVARYWMLPETLVFTIANHHETDLLEIKDLDLKRKTLVVKIADALCSEAEIGLTRAGVPTDEEWQFVKLQNPKKRLALTTDIRREYETYRDFVLGPNSKT